MNAEAEAYLQEITRNDNGYVADLVREGMAWAYADAAKVCREYVWYDDRLSETVVRSPDEGNIGCAVAIEERAK